MADERSSSETDDNNKLDEVMLPGFRFHPTDEELVGFYLKRKIQHKPLSVELIKQLDIYKYDPWDLPKLASIGEKEWYFYCPRDRKYRNSARPNRVTGAGFWKATGTDRPIYNSEGSKCIGLKKSLVFYKGRAAKGIKTDWMMHEFRLPSTTTTTTATDSSSVYSKRYIDRNIPANDAWAICRIFKKANSTTQRALSHSWVSPNVQETSTSDLLLTTHHHHHNNNNNAHHQLLLSSLDNFSSLPTKSNPTFHQFCGGMVMNNNSFEKSSSSSLASFSSSLLDLPFTSYKSSNQMASSNSDDLTTNYTFSSSETSKPSSKSTTINDASSILLNMSSSIFGELGITNKASSSSSSQDLEFNTNFEGSLINLLPNHHHHQDMQEGQQQHSDDHHANEVLDHETTITTTTLEKGAQNTSLGFPYGLPLMSLPGDNNVWKSNLVVWDSSFSPCPSSEISINY